MFELFRPTAQLKVSLTPDCNNDCPICLNKTTRKRNGTRSTLSTAKIKELIDEASDMGMVGVYWTGGEPIIEYNRVLELSEYSAKKGLLSTIVSNGGLIGASGNYKALNRALLERARLYNLNTTQIVKSLKDAGVTRVYFSVDSSHTTIKGVDSNVYNVVPAEAVSQAINAFLDEGYGSRHKLDAIGYQLRVTATASGPLSEPTNEIIEDVMKKVGMKFRNAMSTSIFLFENEKGVLLLRRLNVASLGDAEHLNDDILENRSGKELYHIKCPHFLPRENAYDVGKHHGDLFVDHDGMVYTCGNHAHPVGNVHEESVSAIVDGLNRPTSEGKFALSRRVYYSLLLLSRQKEVGAMAVGEAFRLICSEYPELVGSIKTQCGACSRLGHNRSLQQAFLKVFDKYHN